MAEPLSLLASIAGVATAGATIAIGLAELAHTIKHAPKEVVDLANELTFLSSLLQNLKLAIKSHGHLCKKKLVSDIRAILRNIRKVHVEVKKLALESSSNFYRMKLFFRAPKTKATIARVESFKATVNLIYNTLQLAILQEQKSQPDAKNKDGLVSQEILECRSLLQSLVNANIDSINKLRKEEQRSGIPDPPSRQYTSAMPTSTAPRRAHPKDHLLGTHRGYEQQSRNPQNKSEGPDMLRVNSGHSDTAKTVQTLLDDESIQDINSSARRHGEARISARHALAAFHHAKNTPDVLSAQGMQPSRPSGTPQQISQAQSTAARKFAPAPPSPPPMSPMRPSEATTTQKEETRLTVGSQEPGRLASPGPSNPESHGDLAPTNTKQFTRDGPEGPNTPRPITLDHDSFSSSDSEEDIIHGGQWESDSVEEETEDDESDYDDFSSGVTWDPLNDILKNSGYDPSAPAIEPSDSASQIRTRKVNFTKDTKRKAPVNSGFAGKQSLYKWNEQPEDTATWLYSLVFGNELGYAVAGADSTMLQRKDVATPESVHALVLRWTECSPMTPLQDKRMLTIEDNKWKDQVSKNAKSILDYQSTVQDDSSTDSTSDEMTRSRRRHSRTRSPPRMRPPKVPDPSPAPQNQKKGPGNRSSPGDGSKPNPFAPSAEKDYSYGRSTENKNTYTDPFDFPGFGSETYPKYGQTSNPFTDPPYGYGGGAYGRTAGYSSMPYGPLPSPAEVRGLEARVKELQEKMLKMDKDDAEKAVKYEAILKEKDLQMKEAVDAAKAKVHREFEGKKATELEQLERDRSEALKRTSEAQRQVRVLRPAGQSWDYAGVLENLQLAPRFDTDIQASAHPEELHGTLFWMPSMSAAVCEMHTVLKNKGWKPLWLRANSRGETWFLGEQPILLNFFDKQYQPQIGPPNNRAGLLHGNSTSEESFVQIGSELIENEALQKLGLRPLELAGNWLKLPIDVTCNDIENLVAWSFLVRETRLRTKYRFPTINVTGPPLPEVPEPPPQLSSEISERVRPKLSTGSRFTDSDYFSADSPAPGSSPSRDRHRRRSHRSSTSSLQPGSPLTSPRSSKSDLDEKERRRRRRTHV